MDINFVNKDKLYLVVSEIIIDAFHMIATEGCDLLNTKDQIRYDADSEQYATNVVIDYISRVIYNKIVKKELFINDALILLSLAADLLISNDKNSININVADGWNLSDKFITTL